MPSQYINFAYIIFLLTGFRLTDKQFPSRKNLRSQIEARQWRSLREHDSIQLGRQFSALRTSNYLQSNIIYLGQKSNVTGRLGGAECLSPMGPLYVGAGILAPISQAQVPNVGRIERLGLLGWLLEI